MTRLSPAGAGLLALLAFATLGEGGAAPSALLAVHAGVVAVAVVALLLERGAERQTVATGPGLALAAFAIASLAGAAVAPYRYAAIAVLLEQGAFVAVLAVAAGRGAGLLPAASSFLLAVAGTQGLAAVAQRLVLDVPRPVGTFLNPNHLAAWLVAAVVLRVGAWDRPAARVERIGAAVAAAAAIAGIAASGSRGAALGLLSGLGVVAWLSWKEAAPRARWGWFAAVAVAVALVGVGVGTRLADPDPYRYERPRIWRASLTPALESPWTGSGPGQFSHEAARWNFPSQSGTFRYEKRFTRPHSDWVRLPAEFGWPAALAAAFVVLLAARRLRRAAGGPVEPSMRGATGALAALVVQAGVDDLTERPALYLLAAALLGVIVSRPSRAGAGRLAVPARAAAAGLIVLVFVVGDVAPWLAWNRTSAGAAGSEEAAIAHNPIQPVPWIRRAERRLGEIERGGLDAYALARESAEHAVRLHPEGPGPRLAAARVEAAACRGLFRDEATRKRAAGRYDEARRRAPYDPYVAIEAAAFLLGTGDPDGARREVERAVRLEPEAAAPRLLLAEIELAAGGEGSVERARRRLDEAVELQARHRGTATSPYAVGLVSLDPGRVRRVASAIAPAPPG